MSLNFEIIFVKSFSICTVASALDRVPALHDAGKVCGRLHLDGHQPRAARRRHRRREHLRKAAAATAERERLVGVEGVVFPPLVQLGQCLLQGKTRKSGFKIWNDSLSTKLQGGHLLLG